MKYVMINDCHPIIFADFIDHCMFKEMGRITSAGFVEINNNDVVAYGKSTTLKLSSDPNDSFTLQRFLIQNKGEIK